MVEDFFLQIGSLHLLPQVSCSLNWTALLLTDQFGQDAVADDNKLDTVVVVQISDEGFECFLKTLVDGSSRSLHEGVRIGLCSDEPQQEMRVNRYFGASERVQRVRVVHLFVRRLLLLYNADERFLQISLKLEVHLV